MIVEVNKCERSFLRWSRVINNAYVHCYAHLWDRWLQIWVGKQFPVMWAQLSIRWQMNKLRWELFFGFSLSLYQWEEVSKSLSLGISLFQFQKFSRSPKFASSKRSPFLYSFLLLKWKSLMGNFLHSSFLNDEFASYLTPSVTLVICCIVTSLGWSTWLLTLSWHMMLCVAISLLFLIESDISHDSLSPISCSPSAPLP